MTVEAQRREPQTHHLATTRGQPAVPAQLVALRDGAPRGGIEPGRYPHHLARVSQQLSQRRLGASRILGHSGTHLRAFPEPLHRCVLRAERSSMRYCDGPKSTRSGPDERRTRHEHRTPQTAMSQPQPASPESSDVNAATLSAVLRAARNSPATHTEHVAAAVCGHDPERILAAAAGRGKCAALVVTALGADLAAGSVLAVLDYRSCPPWLRLVTPPSDLLERHANEQTDGIDLSDAAAGHRRRRTFVEAVDMPGLPTTMLATVAAHPQPWARAAAAANRHTPRWLLRRLAADDDNVVRRAATANHAIPSAWLYSHAATSEINTQRKIARNPRCDPMTLWMLADHTQTRVREYVALNESCPSPLLRRLAQDNRWEVRNCVASNPLCPPDLVRQLATDPNNYVRIAAHQNIG